MFSDHNRNKLEINTGMMSGKSSNIWKQNNTILSKLCIKKKKNYVTKYFELNVNENATLQNLWDAVLKKQFIALKAYISQEKWSKINDLSFHLKKLVKEQMDAKSKQKKGNRAKK